MYINFEKQKIKDKYRDAYINIEIFCGSQVRKFKINSKRVEFNFGIEALGGQKNFSLTGDYEDVTICRT